jgi:hypothetical protein
MWETVRLAITKIGTRTTVISVLLGILVALVIEISFLVVTKNLDRMWPPTVAQQSYLALAILVISILVFMPMTYLMLLREGDDLLTPLRKALNGSWRVEYQDYSYDPNGKVVSTTEIDTMKIGISSSTRKLYMASSLHGHPVFEDYDRTIDNIAINDTTQPSKLIYYYELTIRTRDHHEISGPIFCQMAIEFDEKAKPYQLIGKWYDLDGSFSRSKEAFLKAKFNRNAQFAGTFPESGDLKFFKL